MITLKEIELWVNNDESLYYWWKRSRLSIRAFIRENREVLTDSIERVINRKPQEKTWHDYCR